MENQILVRNLNVNYKVIGDQPGKPVLILHGWGSNLEKWEKIAELLKTNKKIIIPDLPGFGKSQQPESSWSLNNYVEWLNEFTDKVPELNRGFFLLGHSFGGALAAKFAIKYNQKVERLFLVSAACVREKTGAKKVLYKLSKVVKLFSFLPYYEQFRKGIYKYVIRKSDYVYQSGIMKETYLKVIADDISFKLGFVKVSTVIIWGDKDTFTPVDQAYFINKKISGSKLFIIPGANHSLHIKMPEVLAEKIKENL